MNDKLDYSDMTPAQRASNIELQVINGNMDIRELTLEDLAEMYKRVSKRVQILKGQILLEARSRFKNNDTQFGRWVKEVGLDSESQQTRWNYMRLAEFYTGRTATRMSPTVCIEIAKIAHKDRDMAMKAHEYALGRGLSKIDIQEYIDKLRVDAGLPPKHKKSQPVIDVTDYSVVPELTPDNEFVKAIMGILENQEPMMKKMILDTCVKLL